MPMPSIIPPNAVGFYVLIRPGFFWTSAFIDRDYTELGAKAVRESGVSSEQLLDAAFHMMVDSMHEMMANPKIRQLPLEHPDRQKVLRMHKAGVSIFAHIKQSRFFMLTLEDEECRFEKLPARTISEAQQLIMQRPDYQRIENTRAWSWEPTPVH